ncbi:sucrase/ferredoxin-like domain-containing protein [Sporobolomyces koalae]|uniref:sucrase/ferredoxin-like domain-containing protein n=1 Tax=Sporobolomyces koalae TaxID=500713 RepID=UPI00317DB5A1
MATSRPSPSDSILSQLEARAVPIEKLLDACKACTDNCDEDEDDHDDEPESYPRGFDVDLDSDMLGSFKGFARQVVISTGKADWEREVTDETDSLAQLLRDQYATSLKKPSFLGSLARKFSSTVNLSGSTTSSDENKEVPGVLPTAARPNSTLTTNNLSIVNSSFVSSSHHGHKESVMIFPDYKVVHDVEAKKEHADEMVDKYLSIENGRAGSSSSSLRSWPLPYRAVILLCSHKKRDKRCHIAAPLLANQFHHHLSKHDLIVDEHGEDLEVGTPIEEWVGTDDERETQLNNALRDEHISAGERVGVFKISHIGGHRYAGNVCIYFPNGTCIYYGRVTPADVGVIVDRTILKGKIIPEFLRGGMGIDGKNGARGILDW